MSKSIFNVCFVFLLGITQVHAEAQLSEELLSAIHERNIQAVDSLLSKGADVNAKNRFGFTPLMVTGDPEMAAHLIKKGATVDLETTNGLNALLIATTFGTKSMVAVLVEAGADINHVGQLGMTPIMRACNFSKFDSVMYLANKGANANIEQKDGNTALMMCIVSASIILKNRMNDKGAFVPNESYEMKMASALDAIQSLIDHGANLNARRVNLIDGTKAITPLEAAIRLNRQEVIELLKKYDVPKSE